MAAETLEERMAAMEQELARIKQQLQAQTVTPSLPWWEKIAGTFATSEHYEEAMRLGREYRASLRPNDDEETALAMRETAQEGAMKQVNADDIIAFVRSIESQELKTTARDKTFTVRAKENGIEYTPASTLSPRAHPHKWLSRVCEEFSRTNSFRPVDYHHISVNASYALVVIELYLQARTQASQ